MLTLLKKASGLLGDGAWLSGHPRIEPLDLDRDYPDVERLLVLEEWPFLRSDIEVSHRQPGAVALVARKDGRFAGFFTTHAFGDVGYLDMMIIAPKFRRAGIARPLYFKAVRALRRQGLRGLVAHTTNDSARLIRLVGFRPGVSYTLLRREPDPGPDEGAGPGAFDPHTVGPDGGLVVALGAAHREELLWLDGAVFGRRREAWIDALLLHPAGRFVGLVRDGCLAASVCLRERREGALAMDGVNAERPSDLGPLVRHLVRLHRGRRLECFARTGSPLHGLLECLGFAVPDFFVPILARGGLLGQADRGRPRRAPRRTRAARSLGCRLRSECPRGDGDRPRVGGQGGRAHRRTALRGPGGHSPGHLGGGGARAAASGRDAGRRPSLSGASDGRGELPATASSQG